MTLITVDKDTCTKCGLCSKMCSIIYWKEGSFPRQMPGTDEYCMRCGHCLGVCPSGSLMHKEMPPEQTPPLDENLGVTFKQSAQLIKGRRSIREFQDKAVTKEEIEAIIDVARYSPTGHNMQEVRWLVINDRSFIQKLSAIGADWLRYTIKNNPAMAEMFKGTIEALDMGQDIFLRNAPAVVVAYAAANNPMHATDCAISLGYFDLAAQTAGLGCCWAGFFYMSAGSYPDMIKAIALPEGFTPYGALMVGYPKYKYHRAPARKPASIIYRP